ncbi:hypothetical protein AAZV13_20G013300 [Glycine max]
MSDEVNNVFKKYLNQLQLHPLRTNAITVAVLAGFSDAVAQKLSGANKLQLEGYFFSCSMVSPTPALWTFSPQIHG